MAWLSVIPCFSRWNFMSHCENGMPVKGCPRRHRHITPKKRISAWGNDAESTKEKLLINSTCSEDVENLEKEAKNTPLNSISMQTFISNKEKWKKKKGVKKEVHPRQVTGHLTSAFFLNLISFLTAVFLIVFIYLMF